MLTPNFQLPTPKGILPGSWELPAVARLQDLRRALARSRRSARAWVRAEAERLEVVLIFPHVHATRTRKAGAHRAARRNPAPLGRFRPGEAQLEGPRGDDRHERALQ